MKVLLLFALVAAAAAMPNPMADAMPNPTADADADPGTLVYPYFYPGYTYGYPYGYGSPFAYSSFGNYFYTIGTPLVVKDKAVAKA